ncbi:MAG: tRNA 4-thiouridine(8) synthase ThiI [bacterium]|nr:tRNA 4-thiouridine(8) synthase ThiI [bacterium]
MSRNGHAPEGHAHCVLLHYNEIGLKGKNRPLFVNRLVERIEQMAAPHGGEKVRKLPGRLALELAPEADWPALRVALARVFGVAYFALARKLPLDLDAAGEVALEMIAPLKISTFRVRTRKGYPNLPISSQEWNRAIGARIQARRHLPVNLDAPGTMITIEALPRNTLVYVEKIPGPGGLPIGASGKVTALLSGGIDSPVACWRMMKRGCEVSFVHFHGAPYLSRASAEKAMDLAAVLDTYQLGSRLYLVPFGNLQKEIVLVADPALRVVLYRRFMARICERIAKLEKAKALVTGESLGQVASQTLSNLASVEEAVALPILRPLIGMDKEEIIAQAKVLDTFEISIEPDQDCCSLFVPKHPAIRTNIPHLRGAEARLDAEEMIARALAETEVYDYRDGARQKALPFSEIHPGTLAKTPAES